MRKWQPEMTDMFEKVMAAIEAEKPAAKEGLVFSYGQVKRGVKAALAAIHPEIERPQPPIQPQTPAP